MGLRDVALSLPTVVGMEGGVQVMEPEMDASERKGLERSAEVLRQPITSVPIKTSSPLDSPSR